MVVFVVIFLFVTLAWLSYWVMIRPVVLDSVVDEMRRMRSSLEWAMIEDAPGSRTEAAQKLLKYLEYGSSVRFFSFGPVVAIRYFKYSEIRALAVKEREVFEPAPLWIREMWQRHARICAKGVLANSPAWWIPISVVLLASFFSRKVEIWLQETEAATNKLMPDRMIPVPQ